MNEPQETKSAWRKYVPCGCLLLTFMVLVALPVIGWMVWSVRAARLVEHELAKIRAANEPVEPIDLAYFYAIPPGQADATPLWTAAVRTFESESYREATRDLPVVGIGPEIPPVGSEWEQRAAVEAFLERYQDEMAQIHEATKLGGSARFDRDFEDGFGILLPEVQGLRGAARMLILEARVAAHRGDAAAVARSIHAIFGTCQAVKEDPLLIPHLVRVALASIAVSELEAAISSVDFSDADLRMLRDDVRALDLRYSLERSLMGERVVGLITFRNPGRYDLEQDLPIPVRANNEDLALYLSTFAKYLEASREPFPQTFTLVAQASSDLKEVAGGSQINRVRYLFTNLLLPAVDAMIEATARGTGNLACAETSIAIEQHRRNTGQLPSTLAELVPEFLDAVPIDPMDGQPLRYVLNDDGYLLYSVGRNRVDDGGVMGDERLDEVFSVKLPDRQQPASPAN